MRSVDFEQRDDCGVVLCEAIEPLLHFRILGHAAGPDRDEVGLQNAVGIFDNGTGLQFVDDLLILPEQNGDGIKHARGPPCARFLHGCLAMYRNGNGDHGNKRKQP